MFALVDCNNFYASCEKVFNPSLRDRPLVVLSNNDGCVIARSAEAKLLGIPMGAPAFQMKYLIKDHNIAVCSTNFTLYGDMSRRVMATLAQCAPDMEIYSIDEAFLSFEGMAYRDYLADGFMIRRRIEKEIGISVGVGIAPTKTLAKAANWYAKKSRRGVIRVESPVQIEALLKLIPIDEVWGVGRQNAKKLLSRNIKTAYDFTTELPEHEVMRLMTIVGVRTWKELQGISCIALEHNPPPKKSIATTRSFGSMIEDLSEIEDAVATFADSCAVKLRKSHQAAQQIMVFIHTNGFRKDMAQYARNRVVNLPVPTSDSFELISYALDALHDIFQENYAYKKAGVMVSALVPEDEVQTSFLDNVDRPRQKELMGAVDILNSRFGKKTVHSAAIGVRVKKNEQPSAWHMNQKFLSRRYTTHWDDIIEVKV